MGLTVLSVAYPFAPVGPDVVGGAEQVLSSLDEALVARGHRSIVVACEGSRTVGTLVPTPRCEGPIDERTRLAAHARHREAIARALARFPIDVVHLHGLDFHRYLPPGEVPTLVTVHLPPSWYPISAFHPARPNTFLVCVSPSQRATAPHSSALFGTVSNGVRLDRFGPRARKARFALALGRICPEKGFHLALDAARAARMPLLIGGQVFSYREHVKYFVEEITPRLDRERRFLGPLGLLRKRRLLAAARCVVVPSTAAETSSLVAMEALASGTPVVAFPVGALPEIVEHGRTGFLVKDVAEMGEAIRAVGMLDPADCRAAAEKRFDAAQMAERYLRLYGYLVTQVETLREVRS